MLSLGGERSEGQNCMTRDMPGKDSLPGGKVLVFPVLPHAWAFCPSEFLYLAIVLALFMQT